ncbi:hypothetical protein BIY37_11195 [Candidatus Brocadia sapporoensis]|uniref:Uncharacterized protein n=1 Tax=Candidatus Brocadia sapporoensis TaxID=392547 RepID=A0A1V6LXK8_9BACT|nr:hypothetical protein BIY37_11195 [Candidatus Brocadia sapporoensis]
MTLYRKRKSLDRFTLVFYHPFLTLRKNGCNNVLSLKLFPDKVLIAVNFNFPISIYFPYKGDFSFRNGNIETTSCIQVRLEIEPYGYIASKTPAKSTHNLHSSHNHNLLLLLSPSPEYLPLSFLPK